MYNEKGANHKSHMQQIEDVIAKTTALQQEKLHFKEEVMKSTQNGSKGKKTIGNYQVGKTLGQGTFGKVRLGTHQSTGESVAIKILEKDKITDAADMERITREIHILKVV
mmetsp:Transcript_38394/g.36770  ORF Transcript_38394/g.36770 Transcript_38394/m.36770 type:complete len:110 (+) Transcript_38394:120-449(+)